MRRVAVGEGAGAGTGSAPATWAGSGGTGRGAASAGAAAPTRGVKRAFNSPPSRNSRTPATCPESPSPRAGGLEIDTADAGAGSGTGVGCTTAAWNRPAQTACPSLKKNTNSSLRSESVRGCSSSNNPSPSRNGRRGRKTKRVGSAMGTSRRRRPGEKPGRAQLTPPRLQARVQTAVWRFSAHLCGSAHVRHGPCRERSCRPCHRRECRKPTSGDFEAKPDIKFQPDAAFSIGKRGEYVVLEGVQRKGNPRADRQAARPLARNRRINGVHGQPPARRATFLQRSEIPGHWRKRGPHPSGTSRPFRAALVPGSDRTTRPRHP